MQKALHQMKELFILYTFWVYRGFSKLTTLPLVSSKLSFCVFLLIPSFAQSTFCYTAFSRSQALGMSVPCSHFGTPCQVLKGSVPTFTIKTHEQKKFLGPKLPCHPYLHKNQSWNKNLQYPGPIFFLGNTLPCCRSSERCSWPPSCCPPLLCEL